jgi:folate/biopterin transporter
LALLNPVRVKSHTSDAAPDLNVPPSLEAKLRDPAEPSSSQSSFASFVRDTVFFGMEPTPTLVAIAVIYFVEGALGLARLAQTYLLKDELHLGPAELSALSGIFALPWTIKPLYGFVSDGFPLFGYQRKSYLVVAGVLGTLSYWLLGQTGLWSSMETGSGVVGTVAALLLSSTCIAFSDVVADGIVVQRTRQASDSGDGTVAGGLQSLCWGASALGGLLSAYWSGSLLEVLSVREVFSLAAVLPFLVSLIAFGIDEQPAETSSPSTSTAAVDGLREQVSTLWQALKQPDIWRPALFLFLWQATPTSDGAFFFFLTDNTGLGLGLGPEFLGRVRLVTSIAGLAGVWLYQRYFRSSSIKSILFWSTVVSFPLGMLPVLLITHANRALGIPDTALIYGDDVILAALGQISFLPTLVLAARICPPGVEAVLFATLMSIFNGASTVGTEIGAALTKLLGVTESNFHNL